MLNSKSVLANTLLMVFCFQNSCKNKIDNNISVNEQSNICNSQDDTTLLYMELNLNVWGLYSNNKLNQGRVYSDKFEPQRFNLTKRTKHIHDTAFVSFRIIGKNNESIMCLHPFELITGFGIYNNVYRPIFGFDGLKAEMSDEEFKELLNDKKIAFSKYCDSINNVKNKN